MPPTRPAAQPAPHRRAHPPDISAPPALRALAAVALAATLAACGASPARPPSPPPNPTTGSTGATAATATAAAGATRWRTYVPERCRDAAGNATAGCRPRRIVTTDTEIEILDAVSFVDNTAELAPTSYRTIEAVARSLIGNPSILVLEVRGHSDSLLHPADRADLARKRAEVVAAYLIAHGVDAGRVTTYGASDGELHYPPDDARNRRVEFLIVARDE